MILGTKQPLVLSPMVDVTDAAFRSVCKEQGADITCSEMVSAAGVVHGNKKSRRLLEAWPGESPYGVQLMSGNPVEMAQAVEWVVQHIKPDFVDLNLGCPSPNILRSCAGGYLLSHPEAARTVVAAAVDAAGNTPVSVKMRLGPNHERQTFLQIAADAQDVGVAWCTLHGRTVTQGYAGTADWQAIKKLVRAVDIPVVGNGDLRTPDDVVAMRDATGCAGFFVARAAMHDPTVFARMRPVLNGQSAPEPADLAQRLALLQVYVERAKTRGEVPLAVLKRQATRFLQGAPGAKSWRARLHEAPDAQHVLQELEAARASLG